MRSDPNDAQMTQHSRLINVEMWECDFSKYVTETGETVRAWRSEGKTQFALEHHQVVPFFIW